MTLAQSLNAEMVRQGLSYNELGRQCGLSAGRTHAILTGINANPGILTVLKILGALNKSLAWLDRQLKAEE